MQAGDFELVLMTAVLPPAIAATSTPNDSVNGKLNGLMISDTPYGILWTFVVTLGKQTSPLKCRSGFAHFRTPLIISFASRMTVPMSQKNASASSRPRSSFSAALISSS